MSTVLVTGGTGALGSELVPRLVTAGHDVRVLSRKDAAALAPGAHAVKGDLDTGEGLAAAVDGVDVIAHVASATGGVGYASAKRTDVDGTRRLLAAAAKGRPHIVYISIVGVDVVPLGYYRAKLEAEKIIESGELPYTILRTTQWHTLVGSFAERLAKLPVVVVPRGVRSQLLDVGEVADRMTEIIGGAPQGRATDMGGPVEVETADAIRAYLRAKGSHRPVLALPMPGKLVRTMRDGGLLAPDHADGRITFEDWLRSNVAT